MDQSKLDDSYDLINEFYDDRLFHPLSIEFYDQREFANYGYWEDSTKTAAEASEKLIDKLVELLPGPPGKILDVACGKGGSTAALLRHGRPEDVVAINISEKQLATARNNNPGVDFRLMSAVDIEFDDETFDTVVCVEAAFHFNTRRAFFEQAHRVLKPNGYLVLSDILMTLEAERRRPIHYEENYLSDPAAYAALLAGCGFADPYVLDVTQQTWNPLFLHVVQFLHEKFLQKVIDVQQLTDVLDINYRIVADLQHYLIAAARKA